MNETNNLKLNKPEKTDFVSIGGFNENSDKIDALGAPEFDDSGTVNGITDFTTYLSTLVSGTSVFNFFRNLKAGFQYVLHVGQLVNNTVTNNDNLPAAASAVYKLQQSFNSTNSKIGNTSNLPSGITDLVSAILQTNSNFANYYTKTQADTITTGSISYASTASGSLTNKVNGKNGVISGLIKNDDSIGVATVTLASLPNYKPAITTYFVYYLDTVGTSWGYLDTNGGIYFYIPSTIAANINFRVNIPYTLA